MVVYSRLDVVPSPDAILECLRPSVAGLIHDFAPVDDWHKGVLRLGNVLTGAFYLHRLFPGNEWPSPLRDGWEAELKSWPGPNCEVVVDHINSRRQTFNVMSGMSSFGATKNARICEQICGCLARATDGLIHTRQAGFFNAQGESIFPKNPKRKLKTG